MIKKIVLLAVILCVSAGIVHAQDVDYEKWARVLKIYVDNQGRVDYAALKEERGLLDMVTDHFASVDVEKLDDDEQKAFWINAYNAFTIKLIVDKYPLFISDIRTINWGRPWNVDFTVAGREISLGKIEHDILREWDPPDPRIHFIINCASTGCPVLPNVPMYPENLDTQLEEYAVKFINNPDKVRLDKDKNILYHSAIFKWFEEDFEINNNTLKTYIARYLPVEQREYVLNNDIKLKKLDYDWGLNEQEGE